jgi:hypothetical protein
LLKQDTEGITVLDQWVEVIRNPDGTRTQNVHPVTTRVIKFKDAKKIANDGCSYYVIRSPSHALRTDFEVKINAYSGNQGREKKNLLDCSLVQEKESTLIHKENIIICDLYRPKVGL